MSECTSMELHTPHSTEVSCFGESGKIMDKDADSVSDLDRQCPGQDLGMGVARELLVNFCTGEQCLCI